MSLEGAQRRARISQDLLDLRHDVALTKSLLRRLAHPDQTSFNQPRPTSNGCTAIPSSLSTDLTQNPSNYYVNVHNKPYPEGAIRGQLRMIKSK
jgi:hypothetical protein